MVQLTNEELYEKYERYVYSIANRFKFAADVEDLFQEGFIALQKANDKYDVNQGSPFLAYAELYVKGAILKYLNENSLVKRSRELVTLNRSIDKITDMMTQKLNRQPTTFEISCYLEIPEEKIIEAKLANQTVMSMEGLANDDSEIDFYDSVPYIEHHYDDDYQQVKKEMEDLKEPDRSIMYSLYYLDKTQSEVAKELNMNQVQISRRKEKVIRGMRDRMAA